MKNNSLYHYCSVDALRSILSTQTLRLSDISKSNDPKEIKYLFDEYKKWNSSKNENSEIARHNNFILTTQEINQFENETFLVLCLSKKYDTLAMWNRYAQKGVAIEFDEDELKEYLHLIRAGIPDQMLDNGIRSTYEVLKIESLNYYNSETIKNFFNSKSLNGHSDFAEVHNQSPFIKSDFYEDEEETRIVYTHFYNTNIDTNYLSLTDSDGNHLQKIFFKSISNSNFQHKIVIDIPFPLRLIKSITIGPDSSLVEKDISEILFINGVQDIPIKKSKGTFR